MASADWNDVRFDYDGSLDVARRLWRLADQVEHTAATRRFAADTALVHWAGPLATEFGTRIDTETADLLRIVGELRTTANTWAAAWAHAVNMQNRRLFARACAVVRERRSVKDKIWGGIVGHHDLPPEPHTRSAPIAPSFIPMAGLAHYAALS